MRRVKFDIDENDTITGVKTMSLVDQPAIQSEFVAFSNDNQMIELKVNGFKYVVAGLALIPDKDIYRSTENGDPYIAYFTTEAIERIRNKFHREMMTSRVNTDHKQSGYIDGFLIESFIIDSPEREADVKAKGIQGGTIGSWFVAYKILDEQTFNRVLKGELRGFSVEIFVKKMFSATEPEKTKEEVTLEKQDNKRKHREAKLRLLKSRALN